MINQAITFTRRESLLSFAGAVVTVAAATAGSSAGTDAADLPALAEPEFVPENDYPYFGYDPAADA